MSKLVADAIRGISKGLYDPDAIYDVTFPLVNVYIPVNKMVLSESGIQELANATLDTYMEKCSSVTRFPVPRLPANMSGLQYD
jgi:hypothetical protein